MASEQASLSKRFSDGREWTEDARASINQMESEVQRMTGPRLDRRVIAVLEWAREAEVGAAAVLLHRYGWDVVRGEPVDLFRFTPPVASVERQAMRLAAWEYGLARAMRFIMRAAYAKAKRAGRSGDECVRQAALAYVQELREWVPTMAAFRLEQFGGTEHQWKAASLVGGVLRASLTLDVKAPQTIPLRRGLGGGAWLSVDELGRRLDISLPGAVLQASRAWKPGRDPITKGRGSLRNRVVKELEERPERPRQRTIALSPHDLDAFAVREHARAAEKEARRDRWAEMTPDQLAAIARAAGMSRNEAAVWVLAKSERLTQAQIAARLGKSPGTVAPQAANAERKLHRWTSKVGPTGVLRTLNG